MKRILRHEVVEITREQQGGTMNQKIQPQTQEKNLPEKKFRAGAISATVWKNTLQNEKGPFEYKTISFERGYKDKKGEWKSTHSMRVADVPKATLVLQKAYEYLTITDAKNNVNNAEEEVLY